MLYCLNANCPHSENPDGTNFCQSCGEGLTPLLRSRYRIIEALGGGGFGRTYLALDIDKLNERCVVKQFAPQVQGSWALQKATELFEQEAQRLQQLGEHPQIPTLYAYFEENKHLYLVQQFIEGQNLLKELDGQGAFSEQKIWELLSDLLPILQSVHEQQVIHRDIKPENIIRRHRDSKLVLIDFGVAKHATATTVAKPGTTIGSCGYAPLEQMQGGEAYPASDLYSLGATCFHLLTTVNPWLLWQEQGYGWVQSWRQHLRHPVSEKLEWVLSKLLQINHQQRYQSATEVCNDLAQKQLAPIPPTISPSHQGSDAPSPSQSSTTSSVFALPLPSAVPSVHKQAVIEPVVAAIQQPSSAKPTLLSRRSLPILGIILLLSLSSGVLVYLFRGLHSRSVNPAIGSNQSSSRTQVSTSNITTSPHVKHNASTSNIAVSPHVKHNDSGKSSRVDDKQSIKDHSVQQSSGSKSGSTSNTDSQPSNKSSSKSSSTLDNSHPSDRSSLTQRRPSSETLPPLWGSSSLPHSSKPPSSNEPPLW